MKRMRMLYTVLLALGVAIVFSFAHVWAVASTPSTVSLETVKERMSDLNKLGEDGIYFTLNGNACRKPWVSGHSCPNCNAPKVVANGSAFRKSATSIKLWPSTLTVIYPSYSVNTPRGWVINGNSCKGFASFAGWYIAAQKSTDQVTFYRVIDCKRKDVNKYAQAGDIITSSSHAVIYRYTENNKDYYVDDNNHAGKKGNSLIQLRSYSLSKYGNDNVTIARALNVQRSKPYVKIDEKTDSETGHVYRLYNGQCSWHEAKDYVESLGDGWHLVTISNDHEQSFVSNMAQKWNGLKWGGNCWIGAYWDNGIWKWVDDSAFDYSNWNTSYPGSVNKQYACIYGFTIKDGADKFKVYEAINTVKGKWDAVAHLDYATQAGFIAEYNPEPVSNSAELLYCAQTEFEVGFEGAVLRNLPDPDATIVGDLFSDDIITTTAIWLGSDGERWYEYEGGGFVAAEDLIFLRDAAETTYMQRSVPAESMTQSSSFSLDLLVNSTESLHGCDVTVKDTENDCIVQSWYYENHDPAVSAACQSLDLAYLGVNNSIKFSSLPGGTYRLIIAPVYYSVDSEDGTYYADEADQLVIPFMMENPQLTEYEVIYGNGLYMRTSAAQSSASVTLMTKGTHFWIHQGTETINSTDGYTWGYAHLEDGLAGWVAISNSSYCIPVTAEVPEGSFTLVSESTDALTGHIYRLYQGNTPWTNARNFAVSLGDGWNLACMDGDSTAEQGIIENLVDSFNYACWLGGHNLRGYWQWVSGVVIIATDSRWDDNEPSSVNAQSVEEHYLGIYGNSKQTTYATINKWNDFAVDSRTPKGFVVEYTPNPDDLYRQSSIDEYVVKYSNGLKMRVQPNTDSGTATIEVMPNGDHFWVWRDTMVVNGKYTWGYAYKQNGNTGWVAISNSSYCERVTNQPWDEYIEFESADSEYDTDDELLVGMVFIATCCDQNCGHVTWESSDDSVVKLIPYGDDQDFCSIVLVGAGTATVTVGGKYVKTFEVSGGSTYFVAGMVMVLNTFTDYPYDYMVIGLNDPGSTVVLLHEPGDLEVTGIGDTSIVDDTHVETLIVSEGYTGIYETAFDFAFRKLKKVYLPLTLTYMGEGAFIFDCEQQIDFYFDNDDLTMADGAIESQYSNIVFHCRQDSEAGQYAQARGWTVIETVTGFCGEDIRWSMSNNTLTINGGGKLEYSTAPWSDYIDSIYTVQLSDSITELPSYAFKDHIRMNSISLSSELSYIGTGVFKNCINLQNVELPSSLQTINTAAFEGCINLHSVSIPDGVTSIGNSAFLGCASLESVNIPSSIYDIQPLAFANCTQLTYIEIPEDVCIIGDTAFDGCTDLTIGCYVNSAAADYAQEAGIPYIYLDDIFLAYEETEVVLFSDGPFAWPTYLRPVITPAELQYTLPVRYESSDGSVEVAEENGFAYGVHPGTAVVTARYGDLITTVNVRVLGRNSFLTLPSSVRTIEAEAFSGDRRVEAVILPDGVRRIESGAFANCANLKAIWLPSSLEYIAPDAFTGCPDICLYMRLDDEGIGMDYAQQHGMKWEPIEDI